jgi:hypothetical protein
MEVDDIIPQHAGSARNAQSIPTEWNRGGESNLSLFVLVLVFAFFVVFIS